MEDKTLIEVKNIGKKYDINHQRGSYIALRDVIMNILKSPFSFLKTKAKQVVGFEKKEEFWALKDINLTVQKGEVVGIIGANGAGKSTLLKILSQITPPTEGEIIIHGKVGSLLEVGTGFHPELTGRENIFLNGAILGMKKKEIEKKFDEIVAFAGIDKFLDTPVKRYSSGMYVRLAFSVAAHMEPDILLVDEVLAVGDAEFQKKCLGKMDDITKKEGRTILFVSHNLNAIEQLCKKTILLEKGNIKCIGNSKEVVQKYLHLNGNKEIVSEWTNPKPNKSDNPYFNLIRLSITDKNGNVVNKPVSRNEEMYVEIEMAAEELDPALTVGYIIYRENGETLYWSYQTDIEESLWPKIKKGKNLLQCKLPTEILNEGIYQIEIIASLHLRKWIYEPNHSPRVFLNLQGKLSNSPYLMGKRIGILAPILQWRNKIQ